ncbi:rhombosortase [Vibrio sp. RC27]
MYRILILAIITLICIFAQHPVVSHAMIWDRELILDGEWWRILTGNLTHTNLPHLIMNVAALWLIGIIFQSHPFQLLVITIALSIIVGGALIPFSNIDQYVGLSGTLHGLFVYGALQELMKGKASSWLLVLGIIVKVGWEQWAGPLASTEEMIDAPIAIEAHLIGLVAGIFLAFITPNHRQL